MRRQNRFLHEPRSVAKRVAGPTPGFPLGCAFWAPVNVIYITGPGMVPGLSKVQSVDQRIHLECGVGFRQLWTCSHTSRGGYGLP